MGKYQVDISGIQTSKLRCLTVDEMKELFIRYQAGDSFARELLIEGNLKLVLSILKKFSNKTDNLDDLFQIGCIGLIKAIDNFDLSYDVKFSTYACKAIFVNFLSFFTGNGHVLQILLHLADKAAVGEQDGLLTGRAEGPGVGRTVGLDHRLGNAQQGRAAVISVILTFSRSSTFRFRL